MGDTLFFKPRQSVEVTSFSQTQASTTVSGLLTAAGSSSQERLARARRASRDGGEVAPISKSSPAGDGAGRDAGPPPAPDMLAVWSVPLQAGRSRDRR